MDGEATFFPAVEATYSLRSRFERRVEGVSPDEAEAPRAILRDWRENPTAFGPSHDPGSAARRAG